MRLARVLSTLALMLRHYCREQASRGLRSRTSLRFADTDRQRDAVGGYLPEAAEKCRDRGRKENPGKRLTRGKNRIYKDFVVDNFSLW